MGDGLAACLDAGARRRRTSSTSTATRPTTTLRCSSRATPSALKPKIDSGDYKLVGDQTGKWDATVAQTTFEQLYTQNNGKVDGVVSANDTMAGGIVTVLTNNKLAGKVPVTGQDASDEGLQRVIAGTQCGTVFKDVNLEAKAAADLAIAMSRTTAPPTTWPTARSRTPQPTRGEVVLRHPGLDHPGQHQGAVRRRLHHRGQGVHRRLRGRLHEARPVVASRQGPGPVRAGPRARPRPTCIAHVPCGRR